MFNRPGLRIVGALSLAVSALGVMAVPAAAETTLVACNGTCGYYEVGDSGPPYGANCKYETVSYDLDWMSARPPLMHGPFMGKTKVGWQFKVLRSTNFGSSWSVHYTSTWQTARANASIPARAGSGFSRRQWTAPENPNAYFKIRVFMRWWNAGGNVIGNASVEYDHYKRLWNGNVDYVSNYCIPEW